jgi:hypothetical protein
MAEPDYGWFTLGQQALGLEHEARLVAVLYWTPAYVGELHGGVEGEPTVDVPGFFLVDAEHPTDHVWIAGGAELAWDEVCPKAARVFLESRGMAMDGGE